MASPPRRQHLPNRTAPKREATRIQALLTPEPRPGMGNGPGRNQAKAHFSKVFVLILLSICHSVLFRPTVGLLAHNKRSETTVIASLMQTSTNGHWRAVKTQRTPVASYLHGHLCYPRHVLPVLRGAAVSPQLTAARAAGCGGWTWPGCSLGQQEALTLLITCFFYPSSPSPIPSQYCSGQ